MSKNKWIFDLLMEKTKDFNKKSPIKVFSPKELEIVNERLRNGETLDEAIEASPEIS